MLLGNKLDIAEENKEKRQVLMEEAEKLCKDIGLYWGGECSAKTFDNDKIREIFEKLTKEVYLKLKVNDEDNGKKKTETLKELIPPKKKKRVACCQKNEP